jgi:rhamnogalacturonyl hydrolase YesR
MDFLFDWLCQNYSKGYSGYCWGYNFDWANPVKYLKAYSPSIIVTGFIAKGIFEYYKATQDKKALDILKSICDFILQDLPVTEFENGICFSYTTIMKDCCYNANMIGAEILAKTYSITKETIFMEKAKKAVDFTVKKQHENGKWNYSLDLETDQERVQIDFHQGYVLESLSEFIKYSQIEDEKYNAALIKGLQFYMNEQFFDTGRSKWRIPKVWPVDIHNQTQGIITFSKLAYLNSDYRDFALQTARWTIENMQDKAGYFYYQKHKFFTNKIPYMRWAQAWMMLALSTLSSTEKGI